MKLSSAIVLVCLGATLAYAADNETGRFLGSEADQAWARLELHAVHALYGGVDIALCASGSACVRIADKGLAERRFLFTIPEKDARAIVATAIAQDILGVKLKDRPGVPDEARPQLVLENALGQSRDVSHWANDDTPALQAVEVGLHDLVNKTEKLEPAFSGKYDWSYHPFAGVRVTVALFSGRPDPTFELVRPEDWEKLRALTKDLAPAERPVEKEKPLGYHGFLVGPREVPALAKWLSVYKGTVQLGDSPRDVVYKKDEKGLEDWLTAEAKKRGIEARAPR
jgi:hypothetical protein